MALGCGGLLLIALSIVVIPIVIVRNGGMSIPTDKLIQVIILPSVCLQETIFCAVSFWGLRRGWRTLSGAAAPFPWRRLLLGTKGPRQVVAWGVGAGLAAAGVGEVASDATEWLRRLGGGHPRPLPSNALDMIRAFHGAIGNHPAGLWIAVTIVFVVVVAPFTEELMFRGLLQGALQRKSAVGGVILASILFAAFHLTPAYFGALFAVGLVLGVAYHRTGALGVTIIAHATNNAIALALCYSTFQSGRP